MKALLLILISTSILFGITISKPKKVFEIEWMLENRNVYEVCFQGHKYLITDDTYHSAMTTKWITIEHQVFGKMSVPETCEEK